MSEPNNEEVTIDAALTMLRVVVKEMSSYVDGSPAQATFIRATLAPITLEVLTALDRTFPTNSDANRMAVEYVRNVIDGTR